MTDWQARGGAGVSQLPGPQGIYGIGREDKDAWNNDD